MYFVTSTKFEKPNGESRDVSYRAKSASKAIAAVDGLFDAQVGSGDGWRR